MRMGINGETINMSREHSGCQHGFNALLCSGLNSRNLFVRLHVRCCVFCGYHYKVGIRSIDLPNVCDMTVMIGICDVASFSWVMWLCHLFYYISYRGNLVCATPPTSLIGFVHTHTQWPPWHEDDRNDYILQCFTWVIGLCQKKQYSIGIFKTYVDFMCVRFIFDHRIIYYVLTKTCVLV